MTNFSKIVTALAGLAFVALTAQAKDSSATTIALPAEHHRRTVETKLNNVVERAQKYTYDFHHGRRALQSTCQEVESELATEGFQVDCSCTGDVNGNAFSIMCDSTAPLCVTESGQTECFNLSFSLGFTETMANINFCIDFVNADFPDICIHTSASVSAAGSMDVMLDCDVSFDGVNCTTCMPCDGGEGVLLNCRNIDSSFFHNSCQNNQGSMVFLPAFTATDAPEGGSTGGVRGTGSGASGKAMLGLSVIGVIAAFIGL